MSSKWNAQLTEEEYEAIMSFDWVDKTRLNNEKYVVEAFGEISKRIRAVPNLFYCSEPLFIATEYLLDAYERKVLRWERLAVILRHKLDFGLVYENHGGEIGFNPEDTGLPVPTPDNECSRTEFFETLALLGFRMLDFGEAIDLLTESLFPGARRRTDKTEAQLLGQTIKVDRISYTRGDVLDYRKEDVHRHGARVFEAELLVNEKFTGELAGLLTSVPKDITDWQFVQLQDEWPHHVEQLLRYDNSEKALNELRERYETRNLPASTWRGFDAFCQRWCLRSISTSDGSSHYQGVFITAKRMSIRSITKAGVDIFIPRYYPYRDLSRSEKVFPCPQIKDVLKHEFRHVTLQKSKAARRREANDYLARLRKKGMPVRQAWEATRKYFGWGEDAMEDYTISKP